MKHRLLDLDCHPGLSFSGHILKAIFLSLSSSNCWLDVILIFCCLFNSVSVLLISVGLCECHSVPLFFSPLSFSDFFPQSLSESLGLRPLLPGPPSPSLWVLLSFWLTIPLSLGPCSPHTPTPTGLCPPLSLHLSPLLSLSLSPFISLLPNVCLWPLAFCYSLV